MPILPINHIPLVTASLAEISPNPPYLEKNLLSRGGHATIGTFMNPCLKEESTSLEPVEDQKIHEHISQKKDLEFSFCHAYQLEEPWTTYKRE